MFDSSTAIVLDSRSEMVDFLLSFFDVVCEKVMSNPSKPFLDPAVQEHILANGELLYLSLIHI